MTPSEFSGGSGAERSPIVRPPRAEIRDMDGQAEAERTAAKWLVSCR